MVPALRDECGDDFVGRFCMLATLWAGGCGCCCGLECGLATGCGLYAGFIESVGLCGAAEGAFEACVCGCDCC